MTDRCESKDGAQAAAMFKRSGPTPFDVFVGIPSPKGRATPANIAG